MYSITNNNQKNPILRFVIFIIISMIVGSIISIILYSLYVWDLSEMKKKMAIERNNIRMFIKNSYQPIIAQNKLRFPEFKMQKEIYQFFNAILFPKPLNDENLSFPKPRSNYSTTIQSDKYISETFDHLEKYLEYQDKQRKYEKELKREQFLKDTKNLGIKIKKNSSNVPNIEKIVKNDILQSHTIIDEYMQGFEIKEKEKIINVKDLINNILENEIHNNVFNKIGTYTFIEAHIKYPSFQNNVKSSIKIEEIQ